MDDKNVVKHTQYEIVQAARFNKELKELIEVLMVDETIKTKVQLFKSSPFTADWFYKRARKFSEFKRTQSLVKKIEELLEARLIDHGLHKANYGFVIFLLKNHYGYQDKREIETETTHVFKVTRGDLKAISKKDRKFVAPNKET